MTSSVRASFEASLSFALDDFQRRALDALDDGASVVVAAPTGSGKTVVAEYAVHRALVEGGKAFYTAPIKALSNQKYADLAARHGAASVGLLTGDNAVNERAPILVMTTEVLRNMIYARSPMLDGLRYVVLDEVHYLQDAYRGPVWEEVIIHTPPEVDLVCLSATVSNAEDLAAWVTSVRGRTEAVIHEERPIELVQLYMVGERDTGDVRILPTFVDGRPNPAAARLDSDHDGAGRARRRGPSTPRRVEVIDTLRIDDMLPAIYFIFSRAACDDAVRSCLAAGLRLTIPAERSHIRSLVEEKVRALSDADLALLDYDRFLTALENGYAAHHAGMVPPFKEAVEACFVEGLIKVVFATETLALGINMPARTVVIEKLSKFTGERHEFLTAGEYTQLTGRAGRRGIDPIGYAVTLWTPFVPFEQVAALAARRTYELRSSFRPTYNMTVNLVRRYSPDQAHHLLSLSFAQWCIDSDLVTQARHLDRLRVELSDARLRARCELGDMTDYLRQRERSRPRSRAPEREVAAALEVVRPGDVLRPPREEGERPRVARSTEPTDGWLVVVATARRRGRDVSLRAVTPSGRVLSLTPRDFRLVPDVAAHVALPAPLNPGSRSFQQAAAGALQKVVARAEGRAAVRRGGAPRPGAGAGVDDVSTAPLHPVERCPDLELHVRSSAQADRLAREIDRLAALSSDRRSSLASQFDRVLVLLEDLGYLDGWAVADDGRMLAGLYHETDLLIAECLRSGVLDGLTPPALAALVSVFVFEARGPGSRNRRDRLAVPTGGRTGAHTDRGNGAQAPHGRRGDLPPGFPRGLAARWSTIEQIAADLEVDEADRGLPLTRQPDPGFVPVAHQWASGRPLAEVLRDADITGGDFVRTVKALIDLLRQVALVAPLESTADAARAAADALFRGVVSASSTFGGGTPTPGVVSDGAPDDAREDPAHPEVRTEGSPS